MRKIVLIIALISIFASTCFASPLTDYSQGKVSVDVNLRNLNITGSDSVGDADWNAKNNNTDIGFTVGLGNKFAFQYRNTKADTKDYTGTFSGYNITAHGEFVGQEFNLLYKLDKNISAFAGVTTAFNDVVGTVGGLSGKLTGETEKGYQVGILGTTKIADKTTAYGIISAGNKITNYEIGIGQALDNNLELNLFYRDTKYKSLQYENIAGYNYDYNLKGIGYGITYKF